MPDERIQRLKEGGTTPMQRAKIAENLAVDSLATGVNIAEAQAWAILAVSYQIEAHGEYVGNAMPGAGLGY